LVRRVLHFRDREDKHKRRQDEFSEAKDYRRQEKFREIDQRNDGYARRPQQPGAAIRWNRSPLSGVANFAVWVLRNLRINAVMAMRHGDRAAAARSIELIGKHLGMFVDRKQIEVAYVDDADEYLAKIIALVNAKTVEHEPAPLSIDHEPAKP
jgi:hypothetical protein